MVTPDTRNPTPEDEPRPVTFEALMSEIERTTQALERGDLPLDEALGAFERASLLVREAQALLAAANGRLTKLVAGPDRRPEEVALELPGAQPDPAPGKGRG